MPLPPSRSISPGPGTGFSSLPANDSPERRACTGSFVQQWLEIAGHGFLRIAFDEQLEAGAGADDIAAPQTRTDLQYPRLGIQTRICPYALAGGDPGLLVGLL